jgi:microcystin-dependent protein
LSVVATNPSTLLGYGTWAAFAAGRMLVGFNAADTDFDTDEKTGGAKTVALTAAQSGLPQHTHIQDAHTHNFLPRSGTSGAVSSIVTGTLDTTSAIGGANQPHIQTATAVNQNAGPTNASQAHDNMPPFITVHMWKRTA